MSARRTLKRTYKSLSNNWEQLKRSRHKIRYSAAKSNSPTIYFFTPDHNAPAGGIKVIYNHVDILNAAGIRSSVLHMKNGFKCDWFENQTRVCSLDKTVLQADDILVLPEVDADYLLTLPTGIRHLVFNQNTHLTWQRISGRDYTQYPARATFLGFLTVSEHNRQMLQFAYPELPVSRIHLGIDGDLFFPQAGERPRRITYMPRRGKEDAKQVFEMLRSRDVLRDWEVRPLDGLSHREVAQELRSSQIYLAFTTQEGFGLPAAEAMACGNYVIGNHGSGGAEFFRGEFSRVIESGDTLSFAQAVEETIRNEEAHPGWCAERGRSSSNFILSTYSLEGERTGVTQFYSNL